MEKFVVSTDHLLLLARMYVSWEDCEFGAPAIDCKKPYGNSSVLSDMREILGVEGKRCPHCDEVIDDSSVSDNSLRKVHCEMQTVLQILLHNAETGISPGSYQRATFGDKWVESF
jgi:hypothetical protein